MRIDFTSEIGSATGGPVFVWMHGWGQTHKSFRPLVNQLKRDGRHILVDLPGFGQTTRLEKGAGTADYADHMKNLLASRHTDVQGPVILVGHSFGCRVAVQMAARYPDLVKGIVMIAGAGLQRKRPVTWKIRAFALRTLGKLARLSDRLFGSKYREAYARKFGSADYRNAGDLRETFVKVVNENLVSEAGSVACPTLLLYGSEDTETPPELGLKYNNLIADSQYHEMRGFGHLDILGNGAHKLEARIRSFTREKGLAA